MRIPSTSDSKIRPEHLARKAIVYVRQSSGKQVRENVESRRLQYAMAERARQQGFGEVEVIDADLGRSASVGAPRRAGFERMVAQVGLGQVGIIYSFEASRLSRTDSAWCQLFEICPFVDTLVADEQHVYDLSIPDDQLVMGIKGTVSVMELRTIKLRMLRGQEEKAKRGELVKKLKPGYVLDPEGKIVKDPNQRVQDAIALVFDRFRATGTVRQTFKWFHDERVELPVSRYPAGRRELQWQLPTLAFVRDVLGNPIYAGAYVYGRRTTQTVVVEGRARKRTGSLQAPEQCRVFLRDHHPSYIDWETFQENQRMIRRNDLKSERDEPMPAARAGQGLLMGLLRCGRCGRKLHVRYWGKAGTAARYLCSGDFPSGGKYCLGMGAGNVDRRFSALLLEVISPCGVAASLRAAEQLASRGEERRKVMENQLEQLRYEATRAFEQYNEVDPRNRLVAAELERRWNAKLEEVNAVQQKLSEFEAESRPLSEKEQSMIRVLGDSFGRVWDHDRCPSDLRKRIVRAVIEEVVTNLDEETQTLHFIIHWKGGVHTALDMPKPKSGKGQKTSEQDLDIIRAMAVRYGDDQIARVLGKLGRRTAKDRRWSESSVYTARQRYGIAGQTRSTEDPEIMSLGRASEYCGVSDTTITRLVRRGILKMQQVAPFAPWEIRKTDLDSNPVREILERLRTTGKLILPSDKGDTLAPQIALFK